MTSTPLKKTPLVDVLKDATLHRVVDLSNSGGTWTPAGPRSALIFTLSQPLQRGGHVFDLIIEGLEQDVLPRLILSTKSDGSAHSILPFRIRGHATYRLFVYVARLQRSIGIEFPPLEKPVQIRELSARRVLRRTVFARALRNGARLGEDRPRLRHLFKAAQSLLRSGLISETPDLDALLTPSRQSYAAWIKTHEVGSINEESLKQQLRALPNQTEFVVLVPLFTSDLAQACPIIESLLLQVWDKWRAIILIDDDESISADAFRQNVSGDPRISWAKFSTTLSPSKMVLESWGGQSHGWVITLSATDRLAQMALAEVALTANMRSAAHAIYGDEDAMTIDGERRDPIFRPDWNLELFLSQDYIGDCVFIRSDALVRHGASLGWTSEDRYALLLRVMQQDPNTGLAHIPQVLLHKSDVSSPPPSRGLRSKVNLQEELHRSLTNLGTPGELDAHRAGQTRITYQLRKPQPKVTLIIPTRDDVEILKTCIGSVLDRTTYENCDILIVDNGSVEPETLNYFDAITSTGRVSVLPYPAPFNYSAINNFAVSKCRGEIIGLLNNDVEVITPDWLTEMVSLAIRPRTGCVGAKLYYQNGTIQHAGVIVGIGGVAGHSHRHFARDAEGYCGRLQFRQNVTAVTAACLVMRKSVYLEAGGLDEENLAVAYNDVDLCLKVRALGYDNVWTPYAELYHYESYSRGSDFSSPETQARYFREVAYMKTRWRTETFVDPFYSPNLSRVREDFSLDN